MRSESFPVTAINSTQMVHPIRDWSNVKDAISPKSGHDAEDITPPQSVDGVSLIIPAYNEEDRLGPTLEGYLQGLDNLGIPYEVIVIMDGKDGTPEVVNSYRNHGVKGYLYSHKLGRGGAIFEGFRLAKFNVVAYADADGSIPFQDGAELIRRVIEGDSAVVASRRIAPNSVVRPEPFGKRVASLAWHMLTIFFLNLRVKDAHCGFKVFRREVVKVILERVTVTNRAFEVGMMYHVAAAGLPIIELPVSYRHDTRTRMPLGRAVPVMFVSLVGMFLANRTPVGSFGYFRELGKSFNQLFASV
jgi:dolichol-phosphate mannosyltransferase